MKKSVSIPPAATVKNTTLSDIALTASVSGMTVSRYFSNPEKVAPSTRQRIEEAIAATGYVLNLAARSLASNRSSFVVAVVPTLDNALFTATLRGLREHLLPRGLHLLIAESGYSLEGEEAALQSVLGQRPCGIVLHNTSHTPQTKALLKRSEVTVVETGDLTEDPFDAVVSYSNHAAAFAMTRHLIERGCSKVAFVSLSPRHNERIKERRKGYQAALAAAGVKLDRELIIDTPAGYEGGAIAVRQIVARDPSVDGFFFAGGVMSIGALFECQRQGWSVPGRLAIGGFDEYEISTQCNPPITTLRIPRFEIGRYAGQIITDRLSGTRGAPARVDLGFELAVRKTT